MDLVSELLIQFIVHALMQRHSSHPVMQIIMAVACKIFTSTLIIQSRSPSLHAQFRCHFLTLVLSPVLNTFLHLLQLNKSYCIYNMWHLHGVLVKVGEIAGSVGITDPFLLNFFSTCDSLLEASFYK